MKTLEDLLSQHPFFKTMDASIIKTLSSCGQNTVFKAQEVIAHEGQPATTFYLIRKGKVAVQTSMPSRQSQTIQTLSEGDILGWSWLFEPYEWMFKVTALQETHAIALDGLCLRKKCEQDPQLGYQLMKRFSKLIIERLTATRLQLLDVYGQKSG